MLYNHFIEKLTGLQDVIIKNVEEIENNVTQITVEMPLKEHCCPCCKAKTSYVHDYRVRKVKDIPSFGRNIVLLYRRRRYRCKECGKCFSEENTFVGKYLRMSMRLVSYVIQALEGVSSFSSVARSVNLSVSTVLRIFDCVKYPHITKLPEVFSIDEFKGNAYHKEKYQAIITDPKSGIVLDILPCRKQADLIEYLRRWDKKERDKVKFFVSDMWKPYSELSATMFKNAVQIVDKFHYIRQIIWAFERVRKNEQKKYGDKYRKLFKHSYKILIKRKADLNNEQREKVESILYVSDKLRIAYCLKEAFYRIIDAADRIEAKKMMGQWILDVQNAEIEEYESCVTMLLNWTTSILNTFDYPYTNGFTEGCNNKIKVLKRNAYGYRNFERFRNRILHMFHYKKPNRKAAA